MANYPLKIRPFDVPQTVTIEMPARPKQDGLHLSPVIKINDLPRSTVLELCKEFQDTIMATYLQAQIGKQNNDMSAGNRGSYR
jgi:hypothetical protein